MNRRYAVLLAVALLTAPFPAPAQGAAAEGPPPSDSGISPELAALSRRVREVQEGLWKRYGIARVHIVGGGARAILDHLYAGKPLKMRDLDVFVPAGRKVDAAFVSEIGRELASPGLGRFIREELRSRPRANPALSAPERYAYVAGYGSFFDLDGSILDLSLFHSDKDLELNGLADADCIRIILSHEEDLAAWARRSRGRSAAELVREGGLADPFGGYEAWLKGEMRIVHWDELERDGVNAAIRLTRLYAKRGARFPQEDAGRVRAILAKSGMDKLQFTRNLLKLLDDPAPAPQLRMLASLGAFGPLSPPLNDALASRTEEELAVLLEKASRIEGGRSPPGPLGRFKALVGLLEPPARGPVYEAMASYEPLAKKWIEEPRSPPPMEKITLETKDGIILSGLYHPGSSRAVLLLHMMPAAKESWESFAAELSSAGYSTLAIDLRGHGESLRRKGSEEPLDFQKFSDAEHQASAADVDAAADYLKKRGAAAVYLAGASIGANLALGFQTRHPEVLRSVLLSPGTDYRGILGAELAGRLGAKQEVFIAAGVKDQKRAGTGADMARAVAARVPGLKELRILDGAAHGTDLLKDYPALTQEIVAWLMRPEPR